MGHILTLRWCELKPSCLCSYSFMRMCWDATKRSVCQKNLWFWISEKAKADENVWVHTMRESMDMFLIRMTWGFPHCELIVETKNILLIYSVQKTLQSKYHYYCYHYPSLAKSKFVPIPEKWCHFNLLSICPLAVVTHSPNYKAQWCDCRVLGLRPEDPGLEFWTFIQETLV
jgi:hypothetical protein